MPSSKRDGMRPLRDLVLNSYHVALFAAMLVSTSCYAIEEGVDPDPWSRGPGFLPRSKATVDPLTFSRIKATGNDALPIYATGRDAALLKAAENGDFKTVEQLLKQGANANTRDEIGNRPLLHTARLGDVEMTRVLINAGADVNARGLGYTPLTFAALYGHERVVALLLKAEASIDRRSANGLTPMMNAALMNNVRVMDLLVAMNGDVDYANPAGRTALSYAAEGGAEEALEWLIARGADVNLRDLRYNPPLYWAAQRDQRGAIRVLLRHGAERGGVALELL